MNADRDVTRVVRSWLHEDAHEDADRVLDIVLDEIDTTPQRRLSWLAWRSPLVSSSIRLAVAAAAVVVIAVVGYQFLGNTNSGGPGATETPHPTATAEPSASEAPGLPVGSSHILLREEVVIRVTIPAPGWDGTVGGIFMIRSGNADPPDGAGVIVSTGPLYVYADPCQWLGTAPQTPATTVDEAVAALSAQALRDASEPVDVTVDGYAGKSITLHVPDDAAFSGGVFTDCDQGYFGSWTLPGFVAPERYSQGPGQIDELWILDVDGVLTVIDTGYYAGTPAEVIEELRAIAESATFEAP